MTACRSSTWPPRVVSGVAAVLATQQGREPREVDVTRIHTSVFQARL